MKDSYQHLKANSGADSEQYLKIKSKPDSPQHLKAESKADSKQYLEIKSKSDSPQHLKAEGKADSKQYLKIKSESDSSKHLYQHLKAHSETDYYAFHMPGHKRRDVIGTNLPYEIDITEINEFDDLHHATGILKTAMERAASVFHAEETHFLVNGSTVGILSGILGSTEKGDKILVARNCHKSVYNALFMQELTPVYVYPSYEKDMQINGEVCAEDIAKCLQMHTDIKAVVITSPTYDGVVSDVVKIARIVHEKNIPLIVDEAHGAHFGFHSYFPKNANQLGADVVIHSIHKTLPSLTQTALLHLNGSIVNREKIRDYLQMLQSSSPSYVLMASIDACISFLENESVSVFEQYVRQLEETRMQLRSFKKFKLIETNVYDYSKIVIGVNCTKITGKMLYERLEQEFHLQLEMAAGTYVVAMTSLADTKEGYDRLFHALQKIEHTLLHAPQKAENTLGERNYTREILPPPKAEYVNYHGDKVKSFERKESVGEVSAEMIYLYPPGIPLIARGERITKEMILYLESCEQMGFEIRGYKKRGQIEVWING